MPKAARQGTNGAHRTPAGLSRRSGQQPTPLAVLQQFREIFRVSQRHFQRIEARCGLAGAQLWALAEIGHRPGLTVTDLAHVLAIHLSTSSNLLDKLEGQKLVRRVRESADQRRVSLYPTASGLRLLARAPRPVEGIIPDALARMSPALVRRLHDDMQELLNVASRRSARAAKKPLGEP